MTGEALVEVEHLKQYFPIKSGLIIDREVARVHAVDDVTFRLQRGETFGIVGESGCGKSTLSRCILRLLDPTEGSIRFDGHDITHLSTGKLRPLRREMQMIFQDPYASLNPRKRVGQIVGDPIKLHGEAKGGADVKRRVQDLLERVGLSSEHYNRFPHEFSGGQRQRIGIARAVALRPELVVADEPVSALDVSVQAQVVNLLEELQDELGLTYVVIAHDLAVVRHVSDVVGVMYLGGLVEEADSDTLYDDPMHPYTLALMSAIPVPDPVIEATRERILLTGDLPSPADPPTGCRFSTRCPFVQPGRCTTERPALREVAPGHLVACHYAEEIKAGTIRRVV